jgi:hypothetical protein
MRLRSSIRMSAPLHEFDRRRSVTAKSSMEIVMAISSVCAESHFSKIVSRVPGLGATLEGSWWEPAVLDQAAREATKIEKDLRALKRLVIRQRKIAADWQVQKRLMQQR